MSPPKAIATPCIKICVVDGASGLCLGCLRSLTEIAEWSGLTDQRRAEIIAKLDDRRCRLPPKLR